MQPQCQIVFCSLQISELAIPSFPSNSSKQMAALCRETYSIHKEVLQSSASFVMHFECALLHPEYGPFLLFLLARNFTWTRLPGAHPWYLGRILRRSFCGGAYLRSVRPRTNRGRRKPAGAWSNW